MIQCEVTVYQPGTGTRYLLVHGIVTDEEDARKFGCNVGSMIVSWEGHGSYPFSGHSVPSYVAEKLNIRSYMLDAEAIAQFVRVKLGLPLWEGQGLKWNICPKCELPSYGTQGCYHPREAPRDVPRANEGADPLGG